MEIPLTPTTWMIIGFVLMFLEVLTPGFVIFFFGLSALTVSLLIWIFPSIGISFQLILFAILSILYLVCLRRFVKSIFLGDEEKSDVPRDEMLNQKATVIEKIQPPSEGRVDFSGTSWKAVSSVPIEAGKIVRVVAQKNLTLTVEPIEP